MYLKILIINLMISLYFTAALEGYYWRDYTGKIPSDAFVAGEDINGENIYVGHAFVGVKDFPGIFVSTIYPDKDVQAPVLGSRKPDNFVQILCSPRPEYFHWIPTNASELHLLRNTRNFVRGGVENNQWLSIGRVWFQGNTIVGKVLGFNAGDASMWFAHGGKEHKIMSYEVLTYNYQELENLLDVRVNA